MSMSIAEIKVFSNPKMLERYIRKDDHILYDMAVDMMGDNDRLVAVTIDSSDSFGAGLYNLDTKESLITATPKYFDSVPEQTREANVLISDIFRDISNSNDMTLSIYTIAEIEEDIKAIVKNNETVQDKNVAIVEDILVSIDADDDVKVNIESTLLTMGSLFEDDYTHEVQDEFSLDDFGTFVTSSIDDIQQDKKRMMEVNSPATLTQEHTQEQLNEQDDFIAPTQ